MFKGSETNSAPLAGALRFFAANNRRSVSGMATSAAIALKSASTAVDVELMISQARMPSEASLYRLGTVLDTLGYLYGIS
jgi:hypothetical protein